MLLEREHELSILDGLIDAARAGEGALALIGGPAGIGKTTLVNEFRARGRRAGLRVLAARGEEMGQDFPYRVVRQLFEAVVWGLSAAEHEELFEGPARLAANVLLDPQAAVPLGDDPAFAVRHGLY